MKSKHDILIENATCAIEDLFDDTAVSPQTTMSDLEDLRDEIDFKISAIKADLMRGE